MIGFLSAVLSTTLLSVAALFPIVNPIGNAPIFLSLTYGATRDTRQLLARRIATNGFILLVVSLLVGTYILAFFGISLPVVQVGGGLVLVATGWSLLTRGESEGSQQPAARSETDLLEQAFYPLTLPLTVGPGSISVAIALGANASGRLAEEPEALVAALLAPAVISVSIYLSYRGSQRLEQALGKPAMSVFLRLSSFILLCIGVQILWNGFSGLWITLPR